MCRMLYALVICHEENKEIQHGFNDSMSPFEHDVFQLLRACY